MDCIFIFSSQNNLDKLKDDFITCSQKVAAELEIIEDSNWVIDHREKSYILTVVKNFGRPDIDEALIFYTNNDSDYMLPEFQGEKMYCLTTNESGGHNEHLLLEFCFEYLKLNPSHVLTNSDGWIYELKHLEVAKRKDLFYWVQTKPKEILNV